MRKFFISVVLFFPLSAAAADLSFERNLYYGMENDASVKILQEFLTENGYYKGPITGNFFGLTEEGVKKFQQSKGIDTTGYFGPLSREAALLEITRDSAASSSEEKILSEILSSSADNSRSASVPAEEKTDTQNNTASSALDFLSSAGVINDGEQVTLTWSSQDMTSCEAFGGWKGKMSVYGVHKTGSLFSSGSPYVFYLNCAGPDGTASSSVSISVNPPPPIFSIIAPADKETVTMSKPYTIKWTSSENKGIFSMAHIGLYKNGEFQYLIAENVPNSGAFVWNVPANLVTGNIHQIRIWNVNYPYSYRESSKFNFSGPYVSYFGESPVTFASFWNALINFIK